VSGEYAKPVRNRLAIFLLNRGEIALSIAHTTAQAAKTPSINAPTEALNQRSCWRRMGDSNLRQFISRFSCGA
jgi:hypothetical protein